MSLSAQDKQLIQSSFAKVLPIADQAAEIFYAKLFSYDPSLKPLFKGDMKKQGQMLMSTIKVAVDGLDDLETVAGVLQKLAHRHLDYGVKVEDYTPVGNALIYTLQTGLGDDFTPQTKQAWVNVYKLIADVMRSAAYPDFDANTFQNTKNYHH
ncbi:globin family protein [Pseudoalteromonas sp. SSDWG2]|uniref:globin family protein n=1 Tax=Pseudoalteromonas sp. SSDWG2 TaxID=3139391 RepID=UPI003BA8716F